MADEPQISILDARLAEIDRRLRSIQSGLADEAGSQPESGAELPPRIAVPEPGPPAPRPVALASPVAADATSRPTPVAREPVASPQAQAPGEDAGLAIAALRGLISDHARLLDAMGELLTSGEKLLARARATAAAASAPASAERRATAPGPSASPATASPPPAASPVAVTVGPFASLQAVRDFEQALGALPNVASVDVRGYEGEDRAMVDVHLARPNP